MKDADNPMDPKKSVDDFINGQGVVNLAGILACHSSITEIGDLSCKYDTLSADSWILDSGATNHMTYNRSLLVKIKSLAYPYLITLPNGYKVRVTEIGDAHLSPAITLQKVLFVPSFKFNLISVHCLASHLKDVFSFNSSSCFMQGPSLKSPLEIGRAISGFITSVQAATITFLPVAHIPPLIMTHLVSHHLLVHFLLD